MLIAEERASESGTSSVEDVRPGTDVPGSDATNGVAEDEPEIEGPGRQSFAVAPELCRSESMVEEPTGREGSGEAADCGVA